MEKKYGYAVIELKTRCLNVINGMWVLYTFNSLVSQKSDDLQSFTYRAVRPYDCLITQF